MHFHENVSNPTSNDPGYLYSEYFDFFHVINEDTKILKEDAKTYSFTIQILQWPLKAMNSILRDKQTNWGGGWLLYTLIITWGRVQSKINQ